MAENKQISFKANAISVLAVNSASKSGVSRQMALNLAIDAEQEVSGIGMGVLSDGTPYLNQRGLAALCGVMNAHIGTISQQWNEIEQKPRITSIKRIISKSKYEASQAHIEIFHNGRPNHCYPAEICLAILEYYAFDAGANCQEKARDNYRLLAGSRLRDMIYSQVGYDPEKRQSEALRKWHERVGLNHQSAPSGYFCIFNEVSTVIYELIMVGVEIGEKIIPDISIGTYWATYWKNNRLENQFGKRASFPHRYPDDHPQARSNPQTANCYPLGALGEFRLWLQNEYLGGGKFAKYIDGKREIPPSVAQLAISRLAPEQITDENSG